MELQCAPLPEPATPASVFGRASPTAAMHILSQWPAREIANEGIHCARTWGVFAAVWKHAPDVAWRNPRTGDTILTHLCGTPFAWRLRAIALVLDAGADPNAAARRGGGDSAIMAAVRSAAPDAPDVVAALIAHGACVRDAALPVLAARLATRRTEPAGRAVGAACLAHILAAARSLPPATCAAVVDEWVEEYARRRRTGADGWGRGDWAAAAGAWRALLRCGMDGGDVVQRLLARCYDADHGAGAGAGAGGAPPPSPYHDILNRFTLHTGARTTRAAAAAALVAHKHAATPDRPSYWVALRGSAELGAWLARMRPIARFAESARI